MIVCYVRPHLRLRLGAAVGPILARLVRPAAGAQPAVLVTLAALEAVLQRGAGARVTVLPVGVGAVGGGGDLHVAVLFCFVAQRRAAVGVARPVALGKKGRNNGI